MVRCGKLVALPILALMALTTCSPGATPAGEPEVTAPDVQSTTGQSRASHQEPAQGTPSPVRQPTVAPSPTAAPAFLDQFGPAEREVLRPGYTLLANADYSGAADYFRGVAESHGKGGLAAEARLRLGQAMAEAGQGQAALDALAGLERDYPDAEQMLLVPYFRGIAYRALGQLDRAAEELGRYAASDPKTEAGVRLVLVQMYLDSRQPQQAAQEAEAGLKAAASRLMRIETMERLGRALMAVGDADGAFNAYRRVLAEAGSKYFLGEQLYNLAVAMRQLGRTQDAVRALKSAIVEFPKSRKAVDSIRLLEQMGALKQVDAFHRGMVYYHWGNYRAAIAAYDEYLAAEPKGEWAAEAVLYRALSRLGPGSEVSAVQELQAVARTYPDEDAAPKALLEAGLALERLSRYRDAEAVYQWLDEDFSWADEGWQGAFRLGLARHLQGAYRTALEAWDSLLARDPDPDLKAAAYYWSGRALAALGQDSEARSRWEKGAAVHPPSYYSMKSWEMLHPVAEPMGQGAASPRMYPDPLPTQQEEAELARWFADRRLDVMRAKDVAAGDPAYQRAMAMVRLGMYREANWEYEELLARHQDYGDRLYWLARWFEEAGLYYGGAKLGVAALSASGLQSVLDAPKALAKVAYPLAYPDLVSAAAQRYGLDQLLFTALMRQESEYDPGAESVAQARGLTQIIPPTAQDVARGLGLDPRAFRLDDLYRPKTSVEFGAWFFSRRLKRFGGDTTRALAAYNAGDGNVDRWLGRPEVEDSDVFAEHIPFEETHDYVRRVYTYYQLHRAIYGG